MEIKIKDKYWLINGDCLTELKKIPDEKCDALITDPPAGISFMGKKWDDDKGGRNAWIAWLSGIMKEAMRCLKPGAHGLVWAIPRTSHWTATSLEDAGFEVRDIVTHLFGTGFPKSHNISKSIDKELGAEREIIGVADRKASLGSQGRLGSSNFSTFPEVTAASTNEAKQYDGWGTALKPASEHWILIRKPLSEKTVAKNVLKFGTGGINIDECRISIDINDPNQRPNGSKTFDESGDGSIFKLGGRNPDLNGNTLDMAKGRFPANLVLSHNEDCEYFGTKEVKGTKWGIQKKSNDEKGLIFNSGVLENNLESVNSHAGKETVSDYKCSDGCAVKLLDEQSGVLKSGARNHTTKGFEFYTEEKFKQYLATCQASDGGASRFFYCAKASKSDKGEKNTHPTVKNTKLMDYLIKLITPENGIVLDPFMGSGSTGVSARNLNKKFIGIEKEVEYFNIAKARLQHTNNDPDQWEPIQKVS